MSIATGGMWITRVNVSSNSRREAHRLSVSYCVSRKRLAFKAYPSPSDLRDGGEEALGVVAPRMVEDIRGITDYDALPANAKAYVDFLEQEIETPITIVSTGPKRHEITYRR